MGLAIKPKELIKFMESYGFQFERQRGTSHAIYKKGSLSVPVPMHSKEIKTGTLLDILRQSNMTKKELEQWLGR